MCGKLCAGLAVIFVLGGVLGYASSGKAVDGVKQASRDNRGKGTAINLERAEQMALEQYPGAILEAEEERGLYEIKIRTDKGEVIKLKIDPTDGSLVSFKKKTKSP